MADPTDHETRLLSLTDPRALRVNSKYVAKLTFEERCAIYGLFKMGYMRNILAAAFDLARPTVGYIINDHSPHYKNVRKEFFNLGRDRFLQDYVKEEHVLKVGEAIRNVESQLNDQDTREMRAATAEPHKRADHRAGVQQFWDPIAKITLSAEIRWLEQHELGGPGWYVFYLPSSAKLVNLGEGDTEVMWVDIFRNDGFAHYPTSKAAYDAIKNAGGYEDAGETE